MDTTAKPVAPEAPVCLPTQPPFTTEPTDLHPSAAAQSGKDLITGEMHTVSIPVLRETYEQGVTFIAAQGWDEDGGWRTILANGLGYLRTDQEITALNAAAHAGVPELGSQVEAMLHQLADYQAMYAVMKFRAFESQQLVELLERKVQAYRATERFWDGWGAQVRAELFRLDAENKTLRRQLAAMENAAPAIQPVPSPPSWRQRLRARFRSPQAGAA